MTYAFDETESTPLCEIMGRHKSDKGSVDIARSWHNYTTFYHSIFKDMREQPLRVFELGLGTNNVRLPSNMGADGRPGASLYGWSEFFPRGQIFGADIDTDILFSTDRIQTFYCDQTNPDSIEHMWSAPDLHEPFDIIVEDGLHTFDANVCFLEHSIHKLRRGGYYIVEDIRNEDHALFAEKLVEWERRYNDCRFTLLRIPSSVNRCDNTLLVVSKSLPTSA